MSTWRAFLRVLVAAMALLLAAVPASAQQSPLTQLQFDIVGVRLVVDPPALTVPKNIATQINTSLVLPEGAGAAAQEAIAQLSRGALVEAQLRGPEIPPTTFRVTPGQPIPLPAFALPGDYFLDGIRLVKDGVPLLDAQTADGRRATTIPIKVIGEILVSSVTSRPLGLDEIREKGIVIDENNFRAVNFQLALNIDGVPFNITLPAALPTATLLSTLPRERVVVELAAVNRQLQTTLADLPPQLDRPGLNFSIAPLPFFVVLDEEEEPPFDIPPITGLIVIPGNVAFLNQFFSVMLMVSNVAPDATPLVVRNVRATIALPTGLDRVAGTYEAPGDDPLRLARVDGIGLRPTIEVRQAGPDGEFGTADDFDYLAPQQTGRGEFLVEGLLEGGHTFDIQIRGTLEGLPSGPVEVQGVAAGAVFVRNPTFAVSLAHPRTVRAGESYDLYATVTNTSQSIANLATVGLDPFAISGAELLSDPLVRFETIRPGESVVAKFRLRSQRTGEVTFSSFTGDVAGDIRLTTGVDERGVPLAPNAIVLPRAADALPASLVLAAQRVLGQAFSIATAPAAALPPGVLFVSKATVIARGRSLAEAGQRVQFGGTSELAPAVSDLLLDWLGERQPDEGFDQILRTTEAGRDVLAEVAAILGPSFLPDPLGAQQAFAQATVARGGHLSASGGPSGGGGPPLALSLAREDGVVADASGNALPTAGVLRFGDPATSAFVPVARPDATRYTIEGRAAAAGTFDLGVVVPGASAGTLQQLRFAGVALQAGGTIRVLVDLAAPGPAQARVDRDGDGTVDVTLDAAASSIVEGPPQVVDVVTLESGYLDSPGSLLDPGTYGLLLGVLFDKPVDKASAETLSNYALEAGNAVLGAQLQPSGRLVYLYLRKPVGALVARTLTLSGIVDERGALLTPTTRGIRSNLTDGVRLFGQAREADGTPVPGALVTISKPRLFTIARILTASDGSYEFDYVPLALQDVQVAAQHPRTGETVTLGARMRGPGDRILLNPTFLGRGTVRGRILAADALTPVAGAEVLLIPGQVTSQRGFPTRSNALGEYVFTDVAVGAFTLVARDATGQAGRAPGLIPKAGDEVVFDLVLTARPEDGGRVGGRVFLSDGITPAAGFPVYIGTYDRNRLKIEAVDQTVTDDTGSFAFSSFIPEGTWQVVAVDRATGQVGVVEARPVARTAISVAIVMEATGQVEGVVFDASGRPVAGAVVAGGIALAETDANGFFRIEGVPAGRSTIQAGDPVTRRRGSAVVEVLPGQTVTAAITLEARATVRGRVLDANGNPVPFASVRIPEVGGFTFVIANSQGVYTFPDLPLGEYLLQAPGPPKEALIAYMEANGIDPNIAFTSGDGPGGAPPISSSDAAAVIRAYQEAVQRFFSVDESLITGLPMADLGGFGYTKAKLFQDATTVIRDIRFLPVGYVAGVTQDANGLPTGALTRIRGLKVGVTGSPLFFELERKNSDPQTGAFRYDNVPRFDLETFQTAGVRGGDFQVQAATPFSPAIVDVFGQLNAATPNIDNLVVRFPSAVETNGTISGVVVMPDGVTPAPQGTQVRISFGSLTVTTRADGTFQSLLPIPANTYTVTAQTATGGLQGQATVVVTGGANVHVPIRLLGLGAVAVQVQRPGGAPVAGAAVTLRRGTFPSETLQGVTDGQGRVRFVNVSEGVFSVEATEAGTGLTGRASGSVVRDAEIASLVTITASGRVTGTFLNADGSRAIPFAQVSLSAGGVQAYATTDTSGRFELTAIPVGTFSVEAFDPASNRRGRASGQLVAEGQTVDVTILQLPQGTVAGFVVTADGVTRVGGATVKLSSSGFVRTELLATTRPDGSFRFDGIPQGTFALEAEDAVSGAKGRAEGRMSGEGEEVDLNVVLEPFGTILVTVRDHTGALATNAAVSVTGGGLRESRSGATDSGGQVRFENLPLGRYTLVGRSLADGRDAGRVEATLASADETVEVTLALRGVGTVSVEVTDAAGAPVPSARVTVDARGGFGEAGPAAGQIVGFTDGTGGVTFPSVPVGDFTVLAESGPLAGAAGGSVPSPNQSVPVAVRLAPSGSVTGRILLPGGATPAFQALVTAFFQSQTAQIGALQLATGLDGRFSFTGLPLGEVRIEAFELVSQGVRQRTGTLASPGQVLDFGDMVLDNESPRVTGVTPGDGAVNVAANASIAITFNEPMSGASFTSTNTRLLLGSAVVETTRALSPDGRTLTITPRDPLLSGTRYTLSIAGSPNGPKDEANLSLVDPFVSAFTVRDNVPPVVASTSPAAGAVQVPLEATVRVSFSEPVATATIVLRDASGQPVPGTAALAVGNSVVIFSPQDFLRANTTYTFTVSGVVDLAGNPLAGGTFTASFATIDTIAPLIQALELTGTPRAGGTVTVRPTIAGADTARVEYAVALGGTAVATTAPFEAALTLPTGVTETTVTAVAVDGFGNRSPSFTLPVTIQQNNPPVVQLLNVAGVAAVSQGQAVDFDVVATDDEAVAQVVFSADGVAAVSETRTVPGTPPATTQRFRVTVPVTAPVTGQLLLSAAAIDTAGNRSATASLALPVGDGIAPTVTIVSPAASTVLVPGEAFTLVVDASDAGGLATLATTCAPVLAGCESRPLTGTSTRETFTIEVPASVQPPTRVTIVVSVSDARGNVGSASRVFTLADHVAPVVTALSPVSGSTRVLPGDLVAVSATATDAVGVAAVQFTATSGAFGASQSVPVTGTTATATFSFTVPGDLAPGAQVLVTAVARDAAGNVSEAASLTLESGDTAPPAVTVLAPAAGFEAPLGTSIVFRVRATDDTGVRRVVFRARADGVVFFEDLLDLTPARAQVEPTVSVPVPLEAVPGVITLSAEAIDGAGNVSQPASVAGTSVDRTAPSASVASPAPGTTFDPRQPIAVTVQASDNVSIGQQGVRYRLSGADADLGSAEFTHTAPLPRSSTQTLLVSLASGQVPDRQSQLVLTPFAVDGAGNAATGPGVTVTLLDVVAPAVTAVTPADGATGVSLDTVVSVAFSEPMDPATLTGANVQLRRGTTVLGVTVSVGGGNQSVVLTPAVRPLEVNTLYTVTLTGLRDVAGNLLGDQAFSFRTVSPDTEPPKVTAIDPPNNAVGLPTSAPVTVTFSEAMAPASVTADSFRVTVDGAAVPGARTLAAGDTQARFTPSQPYGLEKTVVIELTGDLRDASNNALVNADGSPITTPITSTFLTGSFAITSPAGPSVIENTTITIAAEASAALAPAAVVFTVNGTTLATDTEAPFSVNFTVPPAASTAQLAIVASARNAANAEIARAEASVTVVAGLRVSPTLLGVPRGATRTLTLSLGAPPAADVPVAVAAGNPAVATVSPANPVIAAGQTSVSVNVTACSTCPLDPTAVGKALGSTSVVATSAFGTVAAVVSVSDPIPGQEISALASAGLAVSQAPAAGQVVTTAGRVTTILVPVLGTAGPVSVPVSVFSSNPVVATATAADVLPGQQTTAVTITALGDGVTTLTLRAGDSVRALTVFVGTPPPDRTPLTVAPSAGVAIAAAPTVGQVIVAPATSGTFTVGVLTEPNAGAPLAVSVSSSSPAVATATASPIGTGQQITTLTVTTGEAGRAVLTLRAGDIVRSVVVFVGTPPPDQTPVLFAPIAGVSVIGLPFIGKAFVPVAQTVALGVLLLPEARTVPTTVTITTSDPGVVSLVQATVVIPAGTRSVTLDLATGAAGAARLTLRAGDLAREFEVVVGRDPVATDTPVIAALPVGVSVLPDGSIGRLTVAPSVPVSATLGVTIVPEAAGTNRTVTVTTSNPAIVSLGGSSAITVTLPAGATTLPIGLTTSGTTGAAVITFEIDGVRRELLVVVGEVPASELPAVTAPVVGVRVG
jgi:hypothetical protein